MLAGTMIGDAQLAANETEVRITSGGVTLAGTLRLPGGPGPHPGVVMVGGSGPADRHNDTLFPPIMDRLTGAGFAVLSYDKRGVGESSGSWLASSLDDFAADASRAVDVLREQAPVRSVGLFGHSEGGWVVLRAASWRDDLTFVVTNAGPGTTPAEQDRYAIWTVLRADGVDDLDVEACLALYDQLVAAGRWGAGYREAAALLDVSPATGVLGRYGFELDEPTWEFLKRKQDHDPVPDLHLLRCPHLALFGGADPLVPVVDSIAIFAEAACRPDRAARYELTVRVFPGADHRIQLGGDFAPGYLDALTGWITSAAGG